MAQVNLNQINRIYYLCIEDVYAATVISEWMEDYKETPINFRNARKEVYGSFVLVVKDCDGKDLRFIERVSERTRARIEIR